MQSVKVVSGLWKGGEKKLKKLLKKFAVSIFFTTFALQTYNKVGAVFEIIKD